MRFARGKADLRSQPVISRFTEDDRRIMEAIVTTQGDGFTVADVMREAWKFYIHYNSVARAIAERVRAEGGEEETP
jgi:hypothetical protein